MENLDNMTQARWSLMTQAERLAMRDNSQLHPKLIGLEGKRIRCIRGGKQRTFRVGVSTGWRPVHLAMRANANGSSDIIGTSETIVAEREA